MIELGIKNRKKKHKRGENLGLKGAAYADNYVITIVMEHRAWDKPFSEGVKKNPQEANS